MFGNYGPFKYGPNFVKVHPLFPSLPTLTPCFFQWLLRKVLCQKYEAYHDKAMNCECTETSFRTPVVDETAYASSADTDQTAPIWVYTVCHSTNNFKTQIHKKQIYSKIIWNEVFKILGHLL